MYATTPLHMFLLDPLDDVANLWPNVNLHNVIDDIALSGAGEQRGVIQSVGSATAFLCTNLEGLFLEISATKGHCLGSSYEVRKGAPEAP